MMQQTTGRVSESSSDKANQQVQAENIQNIGRYKGASEAVIRKRIQQLDKEWDLERSLEVNASTLALSGVLLSVFSGQALAYSTRRGDQLSAATRAAGLVPPSPATQKAWLPVQTRDR